MARLRAGLAGDAQRRPPGLEHADPFLLFLLLSVLVARMQRDRRALARSNEALREVAARETLLARTDPLTGLLNVRAFREGLEEEISRARRQDAGLCLAVVDLNGFKAVNDTFGHAAGDALLRKVASMMRDCVRADDLTARIGGDEFAICFHDADTSLAEELAAASRSACARSPRGAFPCAAPASGSRAWTSPPGYDAVLTLADQAMYAAKRKAETGVVVWRDRDIPPVPPTNTDQQRA
jgi:diguanylate cyclase